MSEESAPFIAAACSAMFVGCTAFGLASVKLDSRSAFWREQAIAHGAAEYRIVDPATGRTEFKWKEESK